MAEARAAAAVQTPALQDVLVLDLSSVGPGARATRILADFGARVVKVGAPRAGVQVEPNFHAYGAQRGFSHLRLDLKADAGRRAFVKLAARADVLLESFRPGVTRRLGIDFETLRAHNPRLVYCSTSGYGQNGPRAGWVGHDLNYLAVGGYLHNSERAPGGKPPLPGATVADAAAGGMHAALSIVSALFAREREGVGAYLDVAVADGVLHLMALPVDEHLATRATPGPGHDVLSGRYACYDVYRCADGKWLAVAAIEARFFENLCRALALENESDWSAKQYDDAAQPALRETLKAAFAARPRDAWVEALAARDTCVSPVNEIAELASDPQFCARGAFGEATHPRHGRFRQLAPLLAGQPRAPDVARAGDATHTQSDELLAAAGVAEDEIAALRARGVSA